MGSKQLCVLSVLACALSIPGVTLATDLSVNGQIQPHGACNIAVGNGGVIDLGGLSFEKLVNWRPSDISLTINCQRLTKVAVKAIDNRKASDAYVGAFGLSNPAIGYYEIYPALNYGSEANGKEVYLIHDFGDAWGRSDMSWPRDRSISWGVPPSQEPRHWEPLAFKTLNTSLRIVVHFRNDIAFNDVQEFDGSATLELVYL
ncbi:DUF1120 domain-containing protein [Burkholderia contaminans]|uniref:DUF1120 domain-containing protein n=1 Tax=Burkholderia contaminans TaxID=488447 RepID=UPI0008F52B3D|nr:DUF1120 domain-containing protein [Burkholderia contaminans]